MSSNKPFVRSNLVRYMGKSHNTNSIPIFFIRNNVRPSHHTWHKHHTPASQNLSQNKTIQCLMPVTALVATVPNDFLRGCACTPWYECEASYSRSSARSCVNSNRNCWKEALLLTWSKSLDYFVRKDMSERAWLDAVTKPVDKKRVNCCVWKHLFFGGSSGTKRIVKKTEKCSFNVRFSKYRCWLNW